jgi:hypothetical protein
MSELFSKDTESCDDACLGGDILSIVDDQCAILDACDQGVLIETYICDFSSKYNISLKPLHDMSIDDRKETVSSRDILCTNSVL